MRFIGFTSEDTNEAVYRFVNTGRFDSMQICYNLLFQHPYEPSRPFGSMLHADQGRAGRDHHAHERPPARFSAG